MTTNKQKPNPVNMSDPGYILFTLGKMTEEISTLKNEIESLRHWNKLILSVAGLILAAILRAFWLWNF
jgi:hypothetical protein